MCLYAHGIDSMQTRYTELVQLKNNLELRNMADQLHWHC